MSYSNIARDYAIQKQNLHMKPNSVRCSVRTHTHTQTKMAIELSKILHGAMFHSRYHFDGESLNDDDDDEVKSN